MSKKGFDRYNRKFQAKQQASSKFKQNLSFGRDFAWMNKPYADAKAVEKLISICIK